MAVLNISNYNLKINYEDITNNNILLKFLPLTIISQAKNQGYVYYDDFDIDLKYKIAYESFRSKGIIHLDNRGTEVLDYAKLKTEPRTDTEPVSEIPKERLIEYFYKYNITVENLLITVFKNEYTIALPIASLFMDTKPDDLTQLETSIEEFIVTVYRRFISTPNGAIPFMPWYGTNIKKYLHELSIYQVEEMLQAEMDGLTVELKTYFVVNDILDYDFYVKVETEESIVQSVVNYKIIITINEKKYTITIV